VVLAESREEVVAYLLAASTHLGAQAAVFVAGSVQLALLGAGQAGHRTGFDACADEAKVGRRLPCQDAAGGVANVGAVEVEPYAPDQVGAIVLAETVVGAGGTASDAVEAFLNTAQKQVAIQGCRVRMQLEDLWKDHVRSLLVRVRPSSVA
jgi:hypothetical protein